MVDFDNPWKEVLTHFFESFMALFFPVAHAEINWKRKPEFLDNEFRQVVKLAKLGKRQVDRLVKVWLKEGHEIWILIHIEVQNQKTSNFAERMFIYNSLIYHRYKRNVVSLAILGDEDANWKPESFEYTLFGCRMRFDYPVVKILDYRNQWDELENSTNPFAVVILAHLIMLATKKDITNRAV